MDQGKLMSLAVRIATVIFPLGNILSTADGERRLGVSLAECLMEIGFSTDVILIYEDLKEPLEDFRIALGVITLQALDDAPPEDDALVTALNAAALDIINEKKEFNDFVRRIMPLIEKHMNR